jgi:ribosomal protein S8
VLTFLKILYVENFILSFYLLLEKNQIIVKLKTYFKNNLLKNLKVLATSTKSVSISYFKLCRIINKNIFILFSTDKGMLTDVECKIKKVGGKILLSC